MNIQVGTVYRRIKQPVVKIRVTELLDEWVYFEFVGRPEDTGGFSSALFEIRYELDPDYAWYDDILKL